MPITPGVEIAGGKPAPTPLIVQFRALGSTDVAIKSAVNKHLATRQQCRGMQIARSVKTASGRPTHAKRIIQFRARQSPAIKSSSNKRFPVG